MKPPNGLPLRCKIEGARLVIKIGVDVLAWAAQHHPLLWENPPNVTDTAVFAADVAPGDARRWIRV